MSIRWMDAMLKTEETRGEERRLIFQKSNINLNGGVNVFTVDANGYPHKHVLWALCHCKD